MKTAREIILDERLFKMGKEKGGEAILKHIAKKYPYQVKEIMAELVKIISESDDSNDKQINAVMKEIDNMANNLSGLCSAHDAVGCSPIINCETDFQKMVSLNMYNACAHYIRLYNEENM